MTNPQARTSLSALREHTPHTPANLRLRSKTVYRNSPDPTPGAAQQTASLSHPVQVRLPAFALRIRAECSRNMRCRRGYPHAGAAQKTMFSSRSVGYPQPHAVRRAAFPSSSAQATDRIYTPRIRQRSVTCFLYIRSPLLPTNNVSHAGDTCILLREEEPAIRQHSETCHAGDTVRSPPLRRGKD